RPDRSALARRHHRPNRCCPGRPRGDARSRRRPSGVCPPAGRCGGTRATGVDRRVMSTCRIEQLTSVSEIDDVIAIEEASFTNPWTREMYLAELERPGQSFCYLARTEADAVVGFCSFWLVVDELHINNLAVVPEE